MTWANAAISGNTINAKENILHKILSIVDHRQMTLHALSIEDMYQSGFRP